MAVTAKPNTWGAETKNAPGKGLARLAGICDLQGSMRDPVSIKKMKRDHGRHPKPILGLRLHI